MHYIPIISFLKIAEQCRNNTIRGDFGKFTENLTNYDILLGVSVDKSRAER